MKLRTLIILGLAVVLPVLVTAAPAAAVPGIEPPRLVLLIVVDQMRYDYLPRFGDAFTGGLHELMEQGAVFTNANLDHYPSVTAVGHATTLTGAPPSVSGIVGNDWYDRSERKNVTSVEDDATTLLGAGEPARPGSSPHRLMVSTVGDELKMTGRGARVIGLSLKDRAAILPAGRMADVALWWDTKTGAFVTSTWYGRALPAWVAEFNGRRPADAWLGKEWRALSAAGAPGDLFVRLPDSPGPGYYGRVYASAFGNDLLEQLAEAALAGAHLGEDDATDVLTVSFSCNDAVGHARGPNSPEVRDITVRTDLAIGHLLKAVDERVGLARTLVVLTSDHGVAPVPEQMHEWKMPAGRLSREDLVRAATQALEAAYGPGPWIEGRAGSDLYLDGARIAKQGLDPAAVERTAAAGVETLPSVWRTYTRSQLLEGRVPPDPWSQRVLKSFHRVRSGDVDALLEPYWMSGTEGTTHGTPWSYDTHIPLVLMGPAVRAGRYDRTVVLNDLAPTLATLLGVETPSGSSGHFLEEIVAR
jgi:predicted AlkP superfamily pyrophosphatase or phosphodiesterase